MAAFLAVAAAPVEVDTNLVACLHWHVDAPAANGNGHAWPFNLMRQSRGLGGVWGGKKGKTDRKLENEIEIER